MSDTPARLEPIMDPGPASTAARATVTEVPPRSDSDLSLGEEIVVRPAAASQGRAGLDPAPSEQLTRVEEKTARIEDKLARFEANNQRVVDRFELASARMSEVAQQADLAAVRSEVAFIARRVRNLPGLSALVACAIVTAVLSAVLTALVLRYLPGVLPR